MVNNAPSYWIRNHFELLGLPVISSLPTVLSKCSAVLRAAFFVIADIFFPFSGYNTYHIFVLIL